MEKWILVGSSKRRTRRWAAITWAEFVSDKGENVVNTIFLCEYDSGKLIINE
ncbi:hypothetical protein [Lysinibacillus sp. ZYM-1]|uniref:hypothetical protein n=1 Tax=Lysinibacillus sp. ZYM-1 TaxID=1681184 RepID=UPI0012E26B37|nr:hypothetical protein [Lysinibacillus sp. ZYM-1]